MIKILHTMGLAALFIRILTASAIAQGNPFVGRWQWDGPATCAKNYDVDNVAMDIKSNRIIFYESECRIDKIEKMEFTSYRLHLTCKGEGETERSEIILARLAASKVNPELLLRIELKSGFVQAYRRCK